MNTRHTTKLIHEGNYVTEVIESMVSVLLLPLCSRQSSTSRSPLRLSLWRDMRAACLLRVS